MAYINIPVKDNTTPLTPTEFNYLIDKLNARRLRDIIDVEDADPISGNILLHNGSGWTLVDSSTIGGGGGGSPAVWGAITGTLSAQTDLWNALNSKLPSTTILPQTYNAVANQWLKSYNASTGLFTSSQPTFTELGITKATIDALGINADTLDSLNSTQFLRNDQSGTLNGDLNVTGNISGVDGTRKSVITDATNARTIQTTDSNKIIRHTSNGTVVVTVDVDSLTNIGDTAEIEHYGTGSLIISSGALNTLDVNSYSSLESSGQYSRIAIQKIDNAVYRVYGELAPVFSYYDMETGVISAIDGTRKIIEEVAGNTYTVVSPDNYKIKRFTSNSPIVVTVNIGSLLNIGETAEIEQYGAGEITFTGSATLLKNSNANLKTSGQYSRVAIQRITASDYRIFGELESVGGGGGGGSTTFTELTDTPASITANAMLSGNSGGSALEFLPLPTSSQLLRRNAGNTAYEWFTPTYLTSYTETDPIFNAHTVKNIANGTGFLKNNGSGVWSYDNSTYLTSVPNATSTVYGTVKLYSDTVQTVLANTVSSTASRTYGVQKNSSGQLVVNVNWVNTTYSVISDANLQNPVSTTSGLITGQRLGNWATSKGLTDTAIANWNTAYGWDDHSTAGYLSAVNFTASNLGAGNLASGVLQYFTASSVNASYKIPFVNTSGVSVSGNYEAYIDNSSHFTYNPFTNTVSASAFTGNASTATILATARTINGTSFNGSANITTSLWGTARTLTIGSTGKSVNGSANVTWSLAEIGAAASTDIQDWLRADVADTANGLITFASGATIGNNERLNLSTSSELFGNGVNSYWDLSIGDLIFRDTAAASATRFTLGRTTGNFTATGRLIGGGLDIDGTANSPIDLITYTRTDLTQPASFAYDSSGGFSMNSNGITYQFGDATTGGFVTSGIGTFGSTLRTEGELDIASTAPTIDFIETGGANNWNLIVDANAISFRENKFSDFRFLINQGGNVSIGGTANTYKLDVSGTGRFTGNLYLSTNATYLYASKLDTTLTRIHGINASNNEYIGSVDSAVNQTLIGNNTNLITFSILNSEKVRIASDGNVGINTTSPSYRLEVQGDGFYGASVLIANGDQSQARLKLNNTASTGNRQFHLVAGIHNVTQNAFSIYDSVAAATRFVIQNSGNVSIGNNNDTYKLDVNGTGRFTNTLRIDSAAPILAFYNSATNYGSILGTSSGMAMYSADASLALRLYNGLSYHNGGFIWKTDDDATELMRLNNSGNLSIGNTFDNHKLDVSGAVYGRGDASNVALYMNSSHAIRSSGAMYIDADTSGSGGFTRSGSGDIIFRTAAATERMRIVGGGNVGIGTSTPKTKFTVYGTGQNINLDIGSDIANDYSAIIWNGSSVDITANPSSEIRGIREGSGALGALSFHTRGGAFTSLERMRITSGGSVGIGTTAPRNLFSASIAGSGNNPPTLGSATGTIVSALVNNAFGLITGANNLGTVWMQSQAVQGTVASYAMSLQPSGGNVNIGTITDSSYRLNVSGTGRFTGLLSLASINMSGSITAGTGTMTALDFILFSDRRLKSDIEDYKPVHIPVKWKKYKSKESGEESIGVIADELEITNPEFIVKGKSSEDMDSVRYIKLLIAKVAELESRLEKLEN